MIPIGYQAKHIRSKRRNPNLVINSYGIRCQISDEVIVWNSRRNGHEFYDSPELIEEIAKEEQLPLEGSKLFYYELYENEYVETEEEEWIWSQMPNPTDVVDYYDNPPNVVAPKEKQFHGYDILGFVYNLMGSMLSWKNPGVETNEYGLIDSLEKCKELIENKEVHLCCREPGSIRIYAVYSVDWKHDRPLKPGENAPYEEIRSDTHSLKHEGIAFGRYLLSQKEIDTIRTELNSSDEDILGSCPGIKAIAETPLFIEFITDLLEAEPQLVGASKSDCSRLSAENLWHQHKEPATELSRMLVVRIYLNDSSRENGGIEFIPKSHLNGIVNTSEIKTLYLCDDTRLYYTYAGNMIVFHPLLLHNATRDELLPECQVLHLMYLPKSV